MSEGMIWSALGVAALATAGIRIGGVWLAKSPVLKKLDEETLSRLFPLVILFVLVFKETASNVSAAKVGSVLFVVLLHLWRRSFFLSVIGGTAFYVTLLWR